MDIEEYSRFDGLGLAQLVRQGQVSAAELARTALAAIASANPALNAVIEVYDTAAEQAAPQRDATFAGVPFLLKDIGSHDNGVKFELGSRLCRGLNAPPFASELVNRFRASGVTVVGRTNIPELGTGCATEPLLYGPTRNPWNLTRSPGGSSGGAAAAVASGMVPIAHANDAGGSIRIPASFCGLVGLKPSRNLNPIGPDEALAVNGMAAEHIVSRSVRDTAAMLDATAGPDVGAWCYTPRLQGSYLAESVKAPRPLRIALNLRPNFPPADLDPIVVDALRAVGRLCETAGHHVEEASLEFDHETVMRAISIITICGLKSGVDALAGITGRTPGPDTLEPHTLAALRDAEHISGDQVMWALAQFNTVARAYGRFFQTYDMMLTPSSATEPFPIGHIPAIPAENFHDWFWTMAKLSPFTASANIAGIPAMSLPLSWSPAGLPIGSHFLAPMGEELTLLQLATQLEAAQPWADRRPPHHVATLPATGAVA